MLYAVKQRLGLRSPGDTVSFRFLRPLEERLRVPLLNKSLHAFLHDPANLLSWKVGSWKEEFMLSLPSYLRIGGMSVLTVKYYLVMERRSRGSVGLACNFHASPPQTSFSGTS
jgi:hypothetical protein